MRKKVEGKEVYRNYGLVVIAFLVVMTVSILIFFGVIRENVSSNTRNSLSNYAGRQCFHLQSVLEVQYEYMEGLASYIGLQEELTDEADKVKALRLLCMRLAPEHPRSHGDFSECRGKTAVWRITVEQITGKANPERMN